MESQVETAVESENESQDRVQMNFYLDPEEKAWLKDRKKHGESASTVVRGLIRKAMEAEKQQPVEA